MAAGNIIGRSGAIQYGSTNMDFASVQATMNQDIAEATPYQPFNGSSGVGTGATFLARHVGSGTPIGIYEIGAFLLAGAAGTAPGLDGSGMNGSTGATTIQWATGCTDTLNTIPEMVRVTGARTRATVGVSIRARSAGGSATETWNVATTPT